MVKMAYRMTLELASRCKIEEKRSAQRMNVDHRGKADPVKVANTLG